MVAGASNAEVATKNVGYGSTVPYNGPVNQMEEKK